MTAQFGDIRTYRDVIYDRYNPDEFIGREWLVEEITQFRDGWDEKIRVIVGEPGSGKSAFLAYLAEQWNCPRHFMRFDNVSGVTGIAPRNFLISIGEQLHQKYGEKIFGERGGGSTTVTVGIAKDKAEVVGRVIDAVYTLPFLRPMNRDIQVRAAYASGDSQVIGERVKRLIDVTEVLSEPELLHVMILNPLKRLKELHPEEIAVILVDALDESLQHPGVKIPDVIPSASDPDFPANLRFIITSRQGDHLVRLQKHILDIDDVERGFKKHNDEDVKKYIEARLNQAPLKPITQQWNDQVRNDYINDLSERSERNFLYLYHFFNGLKETVANEETNITNIGMPDGLNQIYRDFAVNKIRNDISGSIHFAVTAEITPDILSALQRISGVAQVHALGRNLILNLNKDVVNIGVVIGPLIAVNLPMDPTSMKIIQPGMGDDSWEKNYLPILGVLAVSYEALNRQQIADFARVEVTYVDRIIGHLKQFLDETSNDTDNRYRIFHLSFAEYLLDEQRNQDYPLNRRSYHYQIATTYRGSDNSWTDVNWPALLDGYTHRHLIQHIHAAGRFSDLPTLLLHFPWMQAKLDRTDINAMIEDYSLVLKLETEISKELSHTLQMIRDALRLSAHIVTQDKSQLPGQLLGRMLGFDQSEIQTLMIQIEMHRGKEPWLRPITPCLVAPGGSLLRTLSGHTDYVNSLLLINNDQWAVSASKDKTIRIWNLETGKIIHTLLGHTDEVNSIVVTRDESRIVSASSDRTLKIWSVITGNELFSLMGHSDKVTALCLTPDGKKVISASYDKSVRIWDLETGMELEKFSYTGDDTVRPSSLLCDETRIIVCGWDIQIWNLETGNLIHELYGDATDRTSVTITRDKRRLIAGHDKVVFWDLNTGKPLYAVDGSHAFVVTKDARTVISASRTSISFWDAATYEKLRTFNEHIGDINALALTRDEKKLISASADGTLKVWSTETGEILLAFRGHTGQVNIFTLTRDETRMISASYDKTIKVWDLSLTTRPRYLNWHFDQVYKLLLSNDGKQVVSASYDRSLDLWDVKTGNHLCSFISHEPPVSMAITRDGKRVISSSESDETIKIWNTANGELLHTLERKADYTSTTKFALINNETQIISAYGRKHLKVWSIETGKELYSLNVIDSTSDYWMLTKDGKSLITCIEHLSKYDPNAVSGILNMWDIVTGEKVLSLEGEMGDDTELIMTRDGQKLISVSDYGRVRVRSLQTGKLLHTLDCGNPGESRYRRSCKVILPRSEKQIISAYQRTIKIWNFETGQEEHSIDCHYEVDNILLTKNEKQLVILTEPRHWQHLIRVWDFDKGLELYDLTNHYGHINIFILANKDNQLITAFDDNIIKVWDLRSGICLSSFFIEGHIEACVNSNDGRIIIVGDSGGNVYFLYSS